MEKQYKTPGVYVVEKNSFGSSIVANATAIPSFIGFTEFAIQPNGEKLNKIKDSDVVYEPVLIQSMLEYEQAFGGPDDTGNIMVTQHPDTGAYTANIQNEALSGTYFPGLMYPSISNFFSNGGGSCYIISLGTYQEYDNTVKAADITSQMSFIEKAIEQAETTTLILPTDLMRFGASFYYSWGTQLINFSQSEMKYFTIMDVVQSKPKSPVFEEKDISEYRSFVKPQFPSYAGAYFPYLKSMTAYAYKSNMSNVYLDGSPIITGGDGVNMYEAYIGENEAQTLKVTFQTKGKFPTVTIEELTSDDPSSIDIAESAMAIKVKKGGATAAELNALWDSQAIKTPEWTVKFSGTVDPSGTIAYSQLGMWKNVQPNSFPFIVTASSATGDKEAPAVEKLDANVEVGGTETTVVVKDNKITITVKTGVTPSVAIAEYDPKPGDPNVQLAANAAFVGKIEAADSVELPIVYTTNATIEAVKTFLSTNYINMPPSPFMAGIYSRLDNATGVWTPPANVSPIGVIGPVVPLTNKQQENMNVDATAGISVNAIRSFTGKGTLVWGARTNDGNSLDWRYINVRRLFISMETDISMALEAYVFKPNVHNTWVEVKTMIESYLLGLYNSGAFAGTTPATSYQVLIGQNVTMTDEDILNGYMRVSIQVAPVRPAEFIVLTFSQLIGQ